MWKYRQENDDHFVSASTSECIFMHDFWYPINQTLSTLATRIKYDYLIASGVTLKDVVQKTWKHNKPRECIIRGTCYTHDDVAMTWKRFPPYYPFVGGIHWLPVVLPSQRDSDTDVLCSFVVGLMKVNNSWDALYMWVQVCMFLCGIIAMFFGP